MKILVPVDGSDYSMKAVETACDLVKAQPFSSLTLLAVAIEVPELEEGKYITEKMKVMAEAALARAKDLALAKGPRIKIDTILAIGPSPAEEIVAVAKKEKADLIVIGSRGLAGKTTSFLGSTASKVVTYSPCSVLVVKS
jgi:nucleotide-binding universal stress UspA family protein